MTLDTQAFFFFFQCNNFQICSCEKKRKKEISIEYIKYLEVVEKRLYVVGT